MEINLGNNFGGNMGVRPETAGDGVGNVRRTAADGSQASRSIANLTIGDGPVGLSSAEPTTAVPDAALRRDDDLGNLVNSAFSLPPPQMPTFAD